MRRSCETQTLRNALFDDLPPRPGWLLLRLWEHTKLVKKAVAFLLLIAGLPLGSSAYAIPASGAVHKIKQPNGKVFQVVQRGDEHRNWVETIDGYTIAKASNKYWYYVQRFEGAQPVLSAHRADKLAPSGLTMHQNPAGPNDFEVLHPPPSEPFNDGSLLTGPLTGNVLFILVDYNDTPATYTTVSDWSSMLGPRIVQSGFPWTSSSKNVRDYYAEASYGAVTLLPAEETHGQSNPLWSDGVIGWLRLNKNHPNPGSSAVSASGIALDAIIAAAPYIDYASYDANGDGAVAPSELAIVIIAAGYEASTVASGANYEPGVWAHVSPTVVNADGVYIVGVAIMGEIHHDDTDGDHQATLGTVVHELGHLVFGLPDLYDRDGSSSGIGGFCVMSGGAWGRDILSDTYLGETPVLPSAWVQHKLQWVSAQAGGYIVSAGRESAPGSTPKVGIANINVGTGGAVLCSADEYFLMQYRRNVGYDRGLNEFLDPLFGNFQAGVAIFHVDETRNHNDWSRRLVDVEEADGTVMGSYAGENSDLWDLTNVSLFNDASNPTSDGNSGRESGVEVEVLNQGFTVSGERTINLRVESDCN